MTQKKYKFHVNGMHCGACELLIESELRDLNNISYVKADLKNNVVDVVGDFGEKKSNEISQELSNILKVHGYKLFSEKQEKNINWSDFKFAFPIAVVFIVFFIILQKLGIVNLINSTKITFGTAFIVGIVASLSTCMAIVGGLLLSMSATFAKGGDKIKPQLMFHVGRLVSFFIFGGVIGVLGSAFTLNIYASFILSLIIGLVMLVLGINLLDIFHWTKKIQPSVPKFISKYAHGISRFNHSLTPLLVGVATFFLPCGFTQSMQLYTLSTGNFWSGSMTMFSFALGTLPVLALISFSSFSIKNSSKSGIFFKSAGLVVIIFAMFNIINSLVVAGLVPPFLNL